MFVHGSPQAAHSNDLRTIHFQSRNRDLSNLSLPDQQCRIAAPFKVFGPIVQVWMKKWKLNGSSIAGPDGPI
jgi:hypothetical protein